MNPDNIVEGWAHLLTGGVWHNHFHDCKTGEVGIGPRFLQGAPILKHDEFTPPPEGFGCPRCFKAWCEMPKQRWLKHLLDIGAKMQPIKKQPKCEEQVAEIDFAALMRFITEDTNWADRAQNG